MDELQEKIEGMQAQIEESDQMIRDLQRTVCLLKEEKARLENELYALKLDCQFQSGKIAAFEHVFNVMRK